MTGKSTRRVAASMAAALFLLLPGCLLDLRPGTMNQPGTPVDTQSDEPAVETEVDDDFIAPDPDVPDEAGLCEVSCNDGWIPACSTDQVWCVSSYQGQGSCCTAFDGCQGLPAGHDGWQNFPGIWATAGPYDFRPQEFFDQMNLPALTIVYSGYNGADIVASIACFDAEGEKVGPGELHYIDPPTECSSASCSIWTQSGACNGVTTGGCGTDCSYHYWCVSYSPEP